MPRQPQSRLDWKVLRDRAEKFATAPKTVAAIQGGLTKPEQIRAAIKDPVSFLASYGVKIPQNLELEFADREPRTLPGPDWFPFIFEFFNCRTYWVRECDDQAPPLCKFRQESVCFGFRIYPKGFPRVG